MEGIFGKRAKKVLTKLMASTLIVTLSCSNFLVCGKYFVTYAAEGTELDKQTDATLSKNVKFDAYFEAGGEKTHYKTADLNNETVELVLSTHVQKDGYLKNATIDLKDEKGQNSINYTVTNLEDANAIVQSASENQLVLRQINSGDRLEVRATLEPGVKKAPAVEELNSNNKIILKGLYVDGKGEETPIEKEIEINLGWSAKYDATITQSLIKYIGVEQEQENKTLISMQIETGLTEQKFMLPVNQTNLEITVPTINGEKPTSVTVNAISTEATNGLTSENLEFTEENWEYIDSESKIKINVKNTDKQTGKNKDIYIVNYIYSQKVYEALENGQGKIDAQAKVNIEIYSNTGTQTCSAENRNQITLTETVGKLVSLTGDKITESIAKGKFYANINNPESNDNTEYEYKWNVNVAYNEGLAGIIITDKQEKMVSSQNKEGSLTGKTLYKQIVFNSVTFDELFGEEGKISIYNGDKLLAIVAKDSRTDKDGNYLVELLEEVSTLRMETTKPVKNGNLSVSVKKEIKSDIGFTKTQIDNFETLNIVAEIAQIDEKTNEQILVEEKVVSIPLEATVTKSQISINKEKLSTLVKNENVEITIELGNDNETSDLYIDPIFEIELPQCVENVEILESQILFDEELLIDNVEFIHKDGIPMIRIMLNGVQTKYSSGVVTNGTNIVLKTNVIVNNLTPTSTEEIKMYYYNSNTVNYENGVQTDKGLGGLATTHIEFVAPTGMLTINAMENYNENGDILMSVNQGDLMQQIITYRPARIAKMRLLAINNTGNMCDNIVVLGRVPFAGNKDLQTGEDLGTTIDTYLRGFITAENLQGDGIKIYYSENGEATTALADEVNAWTDAPTDLSKMKSYMIVLEGYQMEQGEAIEFTYDFEIPAYIGYNNTINSNYGIYYVNNTQVATVSSFAKADRVGITTGTGPELNITQTVEGANEEKVTEEYRVLKYTVTVTNTGTEAATDVNIQNEIPKWTYLVRPLDSDKQVTSSNVEVYYNQDNSQSLRNEWNVVNDSTGDYRTPPVVGWTIPSIEPGETVTKEIYIQTMETPDIYSYYQDYQGFTMGEDGKFYISTSKFDAETNTSYEQKNEITSVPEISVKNVALVSASNINAVLKSSSEEVTVNNSEEQVSENVFTSTSGQALEGEEISFTISLMRPEDASTIKIEKVLPEEFQYVNSQLNLTDVTTGNTISIAGTYDSVTRTVSFEKSDIAEDTGIGAQIKVKVGKLNTGEYRRTVTTNTKITYDEGETLETEKIEVNIVKPQYTVKQEVTNTSSIINTGDIIECYLTITNVGQVDISGMKILTYIPEAFFIDEVTITEAGSKTKNYSKMYGENIEQQTDIAVGESTYIYMKLKVTAVKEDTQTMFYSQLYGSSIETTITEVIVQTIEQDEKYANKDNAGTGGSGNNNSGNNSNTPSKPVEKTYKISGVAWEDANENGQKDDSEALLEGITVMAINSDTGLPATDGITGEIIQTTTSKAGKYILTNVKAGKYMIVFKYDNNVYTTTSYQKANVSELYNSNAIEKEITIGNEKAIAGVSDVIDLNATTTNLNLGLVNKAKFDLKLEKSVTKITVQNGKGTKSYDFDNSKLAKIEIESSQLAKSMVIIEYTIKVTNEGNVAGYAKKIVDYKAKDLTFNSSLNSNWYEGNDGYVYTTALENTIINPGETKEIKLLLTKQMTENNVGMNNNIAEIAESYNDKSINDRDSVAGNNAQGEDDRGAADTIITVKTGGVAIYSLLAILVLAILVTGISIIKRTDILKGREVYK